MYIKPRCRTCQHGRVAESNNSYSRCEHPQMLYDQGAVMIEVVQTSQITRQNFEATFHPVEVGEGRVAFPVHFDPFSLKTCSAHMLVDDTKGRFTLLLQEIKRQIF